MYLQLTTFQKLGADRIEWTFLTEGFGAFTDVSSVKQKPVMRMRDVSLRNVFDKILLNF